jgi:hypothetical protein
MALLENIQGKSRGEHFIRENSYMLIWSFLTLKNLFPHASISPEISYFWHGKFLKLKVKWTLFST